MVCADEIHEGMCAWMRGRVNMLLGARASARPHFPRACAPRIPIYSQLLNGGEGVTMVTRFTKHIHFAGVKGLTLSAQCQGQAEDKLRPLVNWIAFMAYVPPHARIYTSGLRAGCCRTTT